MIASHKLDFFKLIFKCLYVVLVSYKLTIYGIFVSFPYRCCDYSGCCHCCFLSVWSRLSLSLLIDRFAWLLSQSLFARIAADNWGARIFAFSLIKHKAPPWSRNCNAIHAIIESLICFFVIYSYYSKILKSYHTLVIVHLEIGIVWYVNDNCV